MESRVAMMKPWADRLKSRGAFSRNYRHELLASKEVGLGGLHFAKRQACMKPLRLICKKIGIH